MIDYTVNVGDKEVLAEANSTNASKMERRVLTYYIALITPYIKSKLEDKEKMKLLVKIAGTLSDEEIQQRIESLQKERENSSLISVLQELVDAYEDEDLEEYIEYKINGNEFSVPRNLKIEEYKNLFEGIGNETKGNRWVVDIDSEGKVVLSE